ncbi:hypothetical protein HMPREF9248_0639 [Fannyhessea vaginae PB189-T1-4]|uniref:Uncharacterized protein n=1 Tax=Fannyhessea vaginae PB189-T1-4 TaxID=866774 RepID=A0ABN0AYL5_9ACTN|nr:hypothetical protein HMPREF9248_0639 [Fannyhessea vaginae PB189-T1-4]
MHARKHAAQHKHATHIARTKLHLRAHTIDPAHNPFFNFDNRNNKRR